MSLIAIISDTHENIRPIVRAIKLIKEHAPDLVIHCGDIISPPVVERFSGLPMRFVYGNNDGERAGLRKKCEELGFGEINDTIIIEHGGKQIFVNHGTRPKTIQDAADSQSYDYVFYGHTHIAKDEMIGKTRVINPGALFAAVTYTFALLNVQSGELQFIEVPE